MFDYAPVTAAARTAAPPTTSSRSEVPKANSASMLLGTAHAGQGYTVRPKVASDGRFHVYTFETEYGTYTVVGDGPAKKHVHELQALNMLKNYSPPVEFARAAGGAVIAPVKGLFTTVSNPIGAARATRGNFERRFHAVQRGLSQAGEVVTAFRMPEKRGPDRESDSLIEKIVDRPKERRRIAEALKVDPYTHFVPLSQKLDEVASYSAAGGFGASRALGFVTGEAGTVISGLGTLESWATENLDMAADDMAAANRKRLQRLGISEGVIKRFLLADKLTPSEKTQAVGFLERLSGTPGLDALASSIPDSRTRHGAFAALHTMAYMAQQPFDGARAANAAVVEDVPVLALDDGRRVAFFASDELFWTSGNAAQLSELTLALKEPRREGFKPEIWISGSASASARRELQSRGWLVKTNAFSAAH
ncbi:hypothetical protein [Aurantimonas endophytica]|uniref:Uncharacterized protein n=1 Tax=Aurantimonas endophytica TaxID=1522175 RepID=A0A7W6MPB0_9HYPH|nr:hypothetical protein [Aurantimonas endophytica]MBB4002820.1 hypothetical protein [Aurantimonas endophytica]MCO6403697.1 hypothetical protein [Aurantimonas endophytica]